MKYIRVLILMICILIITGCKKTIIDELPEGYYIELTGEPVDIYSESNLKDIIKTTNIDLDKNIKLDTDSLGEKTAEFSFVVDKNTYIYHVKYNVSDLTKPRILSSGDRYITVGSDVWLCDYIMYGDNYSNEPVCRVEGDYDLNTLGNYNIKYIVTDDAENEETFETVLHVIKEQKNTNSRITTTYFSNVYRNKKTDNTLIGLDISEFQKDIDFDTIKKQGVEFVMIRIGFEHSSNKDISIDAKYKDNIKKAKDAGLQVGVYFYSIATTKEEAIEHANWVLKTLDKEKLDLPIAFDWESFNKWNSLKLSFHDINEISDTFIKTIKDAGYEGMLYSSKFYLESIWENKNNYPVWLAHYTNNTSYEGKYSIWQMCNDGKINGIKGSVDIDIMYLEEN